MPLPSQHLSHLGRQRHLSGAPILGEWQASDTPVQVDMLPPKPEYFALSHAGLDGEDDDGSDVGVLGLLGCFFQSFELANF